jgi:hypothetical protein
MCLGGTPSSRVGEVFLENVLAQGLRSERLLLFSRHRVKLRNDRPSGFVEERRKHSRI